VMTKENCFLRKKGKCFSISSRSSGKKRRLKGPESTKNQDNGCGTESLILGGGAGGGAFSREAADSTLWGGTGLGD